MTAISQFSTLNVHSTRHNSWKLPRSFFALMSRGVAEWFNLAQGSKAAIWVNQGLLEATDLTRLRAEGFDLSDFTYWVDPAEEVAIQNAVETVREHHPGKVFYVERS